MLTHAEYAWQGGEAGLARLVEAHPWVTLVSSTSAGLVVSHLPALAEHRKDGRLAILGHLPVSDAREHELGRVETVVVVQGPHGYVSAGWYVGGPYVSTWNFVVAHLHGTPDPLGPDETFEVLTRTQDHFESVRPDPYRLDRVPEFARRLAPYVVGFRMVPSRVVAKAKLSQDKPADDFAAVLHGLEDPTDVHASPTLAAVMRSRGLPPPRSVSGDLGVPGLPDALTQQGSLHGLDGDAADGEHQQEREAARDTVGDRLR
jgi:transcriptional regulator